MGFEIGRTVAGYEIVEVLGTSNTGVAYKVRNVFAQRFEVLKILPKSIQDDEEQNARFLREIKVHAQLLHPNIVTFYNARDIEGQLVMTMEFVPGVTLAEKLKTGPVSWREASRYGSDALAALEYAHSHGIIHRGLSSENLIITDDGAARLTGFAFAKSVSDPELTAAGVVIGALKYMSPEQVKGDALDLRCDIYSLGIVLYEMLVGKIPFDAKSQFEIMMAQVSAAPKYVSDINPSVPRALSDLVGQALSKSPNDRFQTAREFRDAIERFAASQNAATQQPEAVSPAVAEITDSAVGSDAPARTEPAVSPASAADALAIESALDLAESKLATIELQSPQAIPEDMPVVETLPVTFPDMADSHVEREPSPELSSLTRTELRESPASVFPAVDWWTSRSDAAQAPRVETYAPALQSAVDVTAQALEAVAVAPGNLPDARAIDTAVNSAETIPVVKESAVPQPMATVSEHTVSAASQAVDWLALHEQLKLGGATLSAPEFALTPPEPQAHAPVATTLEVADVPALTDPSTQPDLWSNWGQSVDSQSDSNQLDPLRAALETEQSQAEEVGSIIDPVSSAVSTHPDWWATEPNHDALESTPANVEVRLSEPVPESHQDEEPVSLWTSGPPDSWVSEPAPAAAESGAEAANLASLSEATESPTVPLEFASSPEVPDAPPALPIEAASVEPAEPTVLPEAISEPPQLRATAVASTSAPAIPKQVPVNPDLLTALFGDTLLSRVSLTIVVCAITFFLGTVTLFAVLSVSKP